MKKLSLLVIWILSVVVIICGISCKKYLNLQPDKTQVVPTTLEDCQAILDNYSYMNGAQLNYEEAMSDNISLMDASFNSLSLVNRELFLWDSNADPNYLDWGNTYQRILYANQVLETLNKINPSPIDQVRWNELKGAALFFRSYSLFCAAQLWCKPYDELTADLDLGLPIKLTSDLNEKTSRGTVKETYDRILSDLQESGHWLPSKVAVPSRPSKAAAYGMLARVSLAMRKYSDAKDQADSCLKLQSVLLNFNMLDSKLAYPISQFNAEVIFSAKANGGMFTVLLPSIAKIDSELYNSYVEGDLRKGIFFINNLDGSHSFKGSYDGSNGANPFTGLATDEIYLIRSECLARTGDLVGALDCLNTLLKTRWTSSVNYQYLSFDNMDATLNIILKERRKELLYRNIRWSDLRRLNKEPKNAKIISHTINGQIYTLAPNDLRYALRIPSEVLNRADYLQNPR